MANYYTNPNATTYNGSANNGSDWTQLIAQASYEGGQAFLKTIGNADPSLTDAQLEADENQVELRYARSLDYARRDRSNPGPHIMSAVRNWSRKQALAILGEKVAGKQIRQDFYQPFQLDLQQEIATMISDLQQHWEQEDEQRAIAEQQRLAAKREEAEQAFGSAYPYIRGLSDLVLNGERQRQIDLRVRAESRSAMGRQLWSKCQGTRTAARRARPAYPRARAREPRTSTCAPFSRQVG